MHTRSACVLLAAALWAGCDFTPAIDVATPAFEPAVVVRSVLAAGRPATVRLSVSGDPYVVPDENRLPSATPAGATVTLLRDGRVVEMLGVRPQTCYATQRSTCNAETGRTDTETSGPYDCGAFVGTVPVEPGATYTIRAAVPGLPAAEATVTVPAPPEVRVTEEPGDAATRRLSVRLSDVAGPGTRYALSFFREYGAFSTQVCRRGGPRDTVVVLGQPFRYQDRFATSDPVLLADADPAATLFFATFSDATFDAGEALLTFRADAAGSNTSVVETGGLVVQIAVLSPGLSDAYRTATALFGDAAPFAEPADLPGNVDGGYGLVGAAALGDVSVPPRP